MAMESQRCCQCRLFIFIICFASLNHVSGLECYSCNSLGVGDTHSDEDCVNSDHSKIGTEPCQVADGQVGRCVVFNGSVTIDPPILDPQTAKGILRYCEVYNENDAPANGCYAATEIPSDLLSGVFSVTSFLGIDEAIQGESCYCSKDRCNTEDKTSPDVSRLECYSCNSLGVGETHSNDDCVNFDQSKIGSEPCQVGVGQVGRCVVFKGSVTVDPPVVDPQTAKGTLRYCEAFNENDAPANGCYPANDMTKIPTDLLSGVFTVTSLLDLDESIQGERCYCSTNRCNTDDAADGNNNPRGTATTAIVFSHANITVLLLSLSVYFVIYK